MCLPNLHTKEISSFRVKPSERDFFMWCFPMMPGLIGYHEKKITKKKVGRLF